MVNKFTIGVCLKYFLLCFIMIFLHWTGNSARLYGKWRFLHWHLYILTRSIKEQLVVSECFLQFRIDCRQKLSRDTVQQIFRDAEDSNPAAHFPCAKPRRLWWAVAAVEQGLLLKVGFTADIGCQLLRMPWARSSWECLEPDLAAHFCTLLIRVSIWSNTVTWNYLSHKK